MMVALAMRRREVEVFEDDCTLDGRYRLRRKVTRADGSDIYAAHHAFTGRAVAVKVQDASGQRHARVLREARILGSLRHPGIVEVIDAGTLADGRPFMVTEMVEGRTLEGLLSTRSALPIDEAVAVTVAVGEALGHAHAHAVVHRDVRPRNVLVAKDAREDLHVKLTGFGAALAGIGGQAGELAEAAEYRAPEQLRQGMADARSDVYALGVMLYECLTGHVPFPGTRQEVLRALAMGGAPVSPRARLPSMPDAVAAVALQALSAAPEHRFANGLAFSGALRDALGPLAARPANELSGPSRRRFDRAAYLAPVRILRADWSAVDGHAEEIGVGGVLVLVDRGPVTGEQVHVRFVDPIDGNVVMLPGTVRWVRGVRSGKSAIGLEFSAMPEETRRSIARYVAAMRSPDASAPRSGSPT